MQESEQSLEAVVCEEKPMVQGSGEGSLRNRLGKVMTRVGQNEWISEFDFFSIPLKLNFAGEDTFKTEFGGLVYIAVSFVCIFFTVSVLYPDGIALSSIITSYSLIKDAGNTHSLFKYDDTFFSVYYLNLVTNQRPSQELEDFLFGNGFKAYQDIDGVITPLELSTNCKNGYFCLENSAVNEKATMYGDRNSANKGAIYLNVASCHTSYTHPTLGPCYTNMYNHSLVVEVNDYQESTGELIVTKQQMPVAQHFTTNTVRFDRMNFTTNNVVMGHIANVLPFQFEYFSPDSDIIADYYNFIRVADLGCNDWSNPDNDLTCTGVKFQTSGSTYIVTEQFDDITAPLLFFLSISQTLFYLVYLLFLRNYTNNALALRIADSLVYIPQPTGSHRNFKNNPATFFACLIRGHPFISFIDNLLYRFCQTTFKQCLPLSVQLSIDMIDFGNRCLTEQEFFSRINSAYAQQNLQPAKIVADFSEEEDEDEESEDEDYDGQFEGDVEKEAFKRMCMEHEYFSSKRKKHLSGVLKENRKESKLVLQTQEIFKQYITQVKREQLTKELSFPVSYMQEEISVNPMIKSELQ